MVDGAEEPSGQGDPQGDQGGGQRRWIVEVSKGGSSKRWGCIRCNARQCKVTINSTPRVPETYAKRIRKAVAKCQHETTD
jgi:hypothetical protein